MEKEEEIWGDHFVSIEEEEEKEETWTCQGSGGGGMKLVKLQYHPRPFFQMPKWSVRGK